MTRGGAIHAKDSVIYVGPTYTTVDRYHQYSDFSIVGNFAKEKGGGIGFEGSCKLRGPFMASYNYSITIENNSALAGRDIHVDDYTNTQVCKFSATQCFFSNTLVQ